MASVLIAIPSVFAEAGLATGAGVSGGFAVIGCSVSGFLLPHIYWPSTVKRTFLRKLVHKPGCETLYPPARNADKRFTGEVFLKVTQAGSPAEALHTTRMPIGVQQIIRKFFGNQSWSMPQAI